MRSVRAPVRNAIRVVSHEWPAEAPLRAPSDEVQLWWLDLRITADEEASLWSLLGDEEQRRATAFQQDEHRRRFVARRAARRRVLAAILGSAPADLRFAHAAGGRPFLAGPWATSGVRFSSSHSGSVGIVAIARATPIGVDIEATRPMEDLEQLAAMFFSADERDAILACPPHQRAEAFYRCWTSKEAYLKATGEGLTRPLDSFSVVVNPFLPPGVLSDSGRRVAAGRSMWRLRDISRPGVTGMLAWRQG